VIVSDVSELPDVAALAAARGRLRVLARPGAVDPLVDGLRDTVDGDVRLALGRACTTATRAVEHLTGVLQLPYAATRGLGDFLDALGDRPSAERRWLVVADAAELLRHEEHEVWLDLVRDLFGGPHCLGGGWSTLVLVDDPYGWERSRFGTAAAAEAAGRWTEG